MSSPAALCHYEPFPTIHGTHTGPFIKYTIAKNHTVANGQTFALWGKLETPQGTFYLAPEYPEQAAQTAAG